MRVGLEPMVDLAQRLGDPQKSFRSIHVAGTKGKGSTAAMMAAILSASGIRAGLYSSPHLHRLEERFTIDGRPAAPEEVIGLVDDVREAVDRVELLGHIIGCDTPNVTAKNVHRVRNVELLEMEECQMPRIV